MSVVAGRPAAASPWRRYWLRLMPALVSCWVTVGLLIALSSRLLTGEPSPVAVFMPVAWFLFNAWQVRPRRPRSGTPGSEEETVEAGSGRRGAAIFFVALAGLDAALSVVGAVTGALPRWAVALAAVLLVAHVLLLVVVLRRLPRDPSGATRARRRPLPDAVSWRRLPEPLRTLLLLVAVTTAALLVVGLVVLATGRPTDGLLVRAAGVAWGAAWVLTGLCVLADVRGAGRAAVARIAAVRQHEGAAPARPGLLRWGARAAGLMGAAAGAVILWVFALLS